MLTASLVYWFTSPCHRLAAPTLLIMGQVDPTKFSIGTLGRTLPAKFRKLLVSLGSTPELMTTSGDWRLWSGEMGYRQLVRPVFTRRSSGTRPIRIAGTSIVKLNQPLFMTTISEQFPCFPTPWTKIRLKFRLMGRLHLSALGSSRQQT